MRGQVAMIGNKGFLDMGFLGGLTVWNLHLGSSLCNLYHLMRCLCRIPPQQVERTKQTAQKTVHPRICESNTHPKTNLLIHFGPKNEGLEDDVSLPRVNFQVPCYFSGAYYKQLFLTWAVVTCDGVGLFDSSTRH